MNTAEKEGVEAVMRIVQVIKAVLDLPLFTGEGTITKVVKQLFKIEDTLKLVKKVMIKLVVTATSFITISDINIKK